MAKILLKQLLAFNLGQLVRRLLRDASDAGSNLAKNTFFVFCVELVPEYPAIICDVKTHPFSYIVFILHLVLFSPFPSLSARSPSRETTNQNKAA